MPNFPGMKVRVKFTEPFKDGQIFGSKTFALNEVAELTSDDYDKAKRSGAYMDVLGSVLPPPDWGENPPPAPEVTPETEWNPAPVENWEEPEPLQQNKPTRKTSPKKAAKDGRKA